MSVLVSLPELSSFLGGVDSSEDALLEALLDHVEGLFQERVGRRLRPYQAKQDGRVEVRDGTGSCMLTLDYPIAALTAPIKIGRDTSNPTETLDPTDVDVLVFTAGRRAIHRTDGGVWGCANEPRTVHVTYDAAADVPSHAKLAVKRVCALIYRQRGSEDASEETIGGYTRRMAKFGRDFVDDDPIWKLAVDAEWDPSL